jgi:hypothetical protein
MFCKNFSQKNNHWLDFIKDKDTLLPQFYEFSDSISTSTKHTSKFGKTFMVLKEKVKEDCHY